jgi:cytochrome c oxidase cbb3-type subunit II
MKNGLILFAGIFLTLAFSWVLLILFNATHPLYGQLEPHQDDATGEFVPAPTAGLAERGRVVYADLGCVACHTQQVRRPNFGSDAQRGWGDRQSVARDYVGQESVHLGAIRVGPDLRNVGERELPQAWANLSWEQYHHLHLYDPRATVEGSVMPSFSFLYETRRIVGQPSARALPIRVQPGYEVVPTERAIALVAYLRSLRLDYDLPEAVPAAAAQEE